jgi:hypothetical protein
VVEMNTLKLTVVSLNSKKVKNELRFKVIPNVSTR